MSDISAAQDRLSAGENEASFAVNLLWLRFQSLGTACVWSRVHGHGGQSSVRLDDLRQSHRRPLPLGQGRHSGGIYNLYPPGNLAGALRGLPGRPLRSSALGYRGRISDRIVLDRLFAGSHAGNALRGSGDRRHRHRPGVRHVHRQCREVVPEAPRPGRGPHGRGIRRGRGAHDRAADAIAKFERLSGNAVQVCADSGSRCPRRSARAQEAAQGFGPAPA